MDDPRYLLLALVVVEISTFVSTIFLHLRNLTRVRSKCCGKEVIDVHQKILNSESGPRRLFSWLRPTTGGAD